MCFPGNGYGFVYASGSLVNIWNSTIQISFLDGMLSMVVMYVQSYVEIRESEI